MKTIFSFKNFPKTNTEIYVALMEVKSILDTIREDKSLDDNHDLSLSSSHIDSCLDALESQIDTKKLNKFIK